ncbi:MAG TPA: DUF932 domain-containing protein [Candidatus Acidoferrales bacterium]|nr:DUF932 domain-containing protein [Candidatus Acidoferrales bacterium]
MAHMLDMSKGFAAIAYAGELPWHGFGKRLEADATLDQWRIAAGLDYTVEAKELFFFNDLNNETEHLDGTVALQRRDTGAILSTVSDKYKIVQPGEVLEFYREIAKAEGFSIETAGALSGGRRVWALARIGDSFELYGRDKTDGFVLFATSYDGTFATQARWTGVRVVCNNTLTAAIPHTGDSVSDGGADVYKVPHSVEFDIQKAHGKLGLQREAWEAWKRHMEALARFTISPEQALEFFTMVAGNGDDIVRNDDSGKVVRLPEPNRVVKNLVNAYLNGPGAELPSAKGTAFGALNAVTFYQDHLAPSNNNGTRWDSATFGIGARRKARAVKLLGELMLAA